jgi:uncharacterized protein (DUF697 family)
MLENLMDQAREAWDRLRFGWGSLDDTLTEQGRIGLVGLPGAGKRTLFNTLWGWPAVKGQPEVSADEYSQPIHDYGLFSLVDLSTHLYEQEEMLFQLEDIDLVIYVIDGACGLRSDDFHWIARLRARQRALLVVLNKADLIGEQLSAMRAEIEKQLAMHVIPLCARQTADVHGLLLPEILRACPKITVPLASQITGLRREAAQRLIRQSTALSLIAAVEPVPLFDVSVLIGLQIHLLSRISALYGRRSDIQGQWTIVLTVAFGLMLRYAAQTLMKWLPFLGWAISGLIGASGTWAVGRTVLAFYEAGFQDWINQISRQVQDAFHKRIKRARR